MKLVLVFFVLLIGLNILSPASADIVSNLVKQGVKSLESGDYQTANSFFDRALLEEPDNIDALNYKASALVKIRKYEDATSFSQKVLAIDPKNVSAMNYMTISLLKLGQLDEANSYLNRALELDPTNVNILMNSGDFFNTVSDFYSAAIFYGSALRLDPDNDAIIIKYETARYNVDYKPVHGWLEIIVRDENLNLVGYNFTEKLFIVDNEFTTQFLKHWNLKDVVTIDGQTYEVHELKSITQQLQDSVHAQFKISSVLDTSIDLVFSHGNGFEVKTGEIVEYNYNVLLPME